MREVKEYLSSYFVDFGEVIVAVAIGVILGHAIVALLGLR